MSLAYDHYHDPDKDEERRPPEKMMAFVADHGCPKCSEREGGNWQQCRGSCPLPMSPHYQEAEFKNQPKVWK